MMGAKRVSTMTLRIMGLYVTLSIKILSMTMLWHNAECHYAVDHILFIIMLRVIRLSVIY
jgi:hypothetical protein